MDLKRLAVAGSVAAGAIGGALIGAPLVGTAQEGSPWPTESPAEAPSGAEERRSFRVCGPALGTAAEAIGIDEEALADALAEGQTIAEVAEANGVEPQAVVDALIAEHEARIDEALGAGRISREMAEAMKDGFEERLTALVNGELGKRLGPRMGFRRPWPGGPHGGPGTGEATDAFLDL